MNEATQAALIELLQKALKGIDTATSFSQEQVPAIIQELLVWNAVSSLLIQVVSIVYLLAFIKYAPKACRHMISYACPASKEPIYFIGLIVTTIFATVAMVEFFDNFDWIKIWIAPKLYLLDYTAILIK